MNKTIISASVIATSLFTLSSCQKMEMNFMTPREIISFFTETRLSKPPEQVTMSQVSAARRWALQDQSVTVETTSEEERRAYSLIAEEIQLKQEARQRAQEYADSQCTSTTHLSWNCAQSSLGTLAVELF